MSYWFLRCNNVNRLYVYIYPLPLEPPSYPTLPHSTPLGHHRALNWTPCAIQQSPTSICFTHSSVCMPILLSQFVPPFPSPPWSTSLFSASLFLPCKYVLLYMGPYSFKATKAIDQFGSVLSNSLLPHESQHTRPPCPSATPGVHSNLCPSSRWCHPAISSSVSPFSSCPQSLPASESFPMSQLFAWGGQSIGVSASASFLPMNTQDWSPLGWTGWISL